MGSSQQRGDTGAAGDGDMWLLGICHPAAPQADQRPTGLEPPRLTLEGPSSLWRSLGRGFLLATPSPAVQDVGTRAAHGDGVWGQGSTAGRDGSQVTPTAPGPGMTPRMPTLPLFGPASVSPQQNRLWGSLHPSSSSLQVRTSQGCREAAASPESPQNGGTPGPQRRSPHLLLPPHPSHPHPSPHHFTLLLQ